MKYSENFNRDFNWYLSMRNRFDFDGKANIKPIFDLRAIDGKKAFHIFDSNGKLVPTRHPNILAKLLKVKSSINLHIKMYAEDRAKGILPKMLFEEMCEEFKAPQWFVDAVERQKCKYY